MVVTRHLDMSRPNLSEEFEEVLEEALIDLGYKPHVVSGASHAKKVSWLIYETDADVDVSEFM